MKKNGSRFRGLPPVLRELHALRGERVWRIMLEGLFVGGGSGLVIGLFRLFYDHGSDAIIRLTGHITTDPVSISFFFLMLMAAGLFVGKLTKAEPLISGSGIPHVELALSGNAPFPWLRVLIAKFVGTLVCLSGGLSVGRQGPSIQMGAAVGCGFGSLFQRLMGEIPEHLPRFLISGGVAGMTAAFGAPLAGILFAFEEFHVLVSAPLLLFCSVSAASAWAVVNLAFGFGFVFPFPQLALSWHCLLPAVLVGLASGLLGVIYNFFLVSVTLWHDRQNLLSVVWKPVVPFCLAGFLFFVYPEVLVGVGYSMPGIAGVDGHVLSLTALMLFLLIKILFSVLSFASGVPGGILMPILYIGGIFGVALGTFASCILGGADLAAYLMLGMAALFSATIRAPLTGAFLAAEMSGAYAFLPAFLAASLTSAWIASRMGSRPVYKSLKVRMHKKIRKEVFMR
ncbi:MAG: chloride channel protein [Mailhella sp.]|nr:chloride channel protein [Mailhella sp.]